MTQIENNLDFYFLVDNIYPNQSFSVHISSHTKSIILQTHQTQISLFYKTHQCLEKLKKKHWNTNKIKIEHLNKNFEIQTLKFRGTQNKARWFYGGRERKRGHLGRGRSWWTDWCRRRWEMSLSVVLGLCLDGSSLNRCCHAWDYEMKWTTGVWYKGWVSEKVKKVILCWFREVGEMSKWEKPKKESREFQLSEIWGDYHIVVSNNQNAIKLSVWKLKTPGNLLSVFILMCMFG